jgi:hypothetical protein
MGGMRRVGALTIAAVLGLGLGACGDDGDDDAAQDDTSDQAGTTQDDSSSGDAPEDFDFTGECAGLAEAFANANNASSSAFTGEDADLEQAAEFFDEAAENAPDEIRGDFEVFAEAYGDFVRAMAESDIDFSDPESIEAADMEEFAAIGEAFSSPEVQEASNNIQTYMAENCSAG